MKKILQLFSFIIISFLTTGILAADTLDHRLFLEQINNSNNHVYNECLEKYNGYLTDHPNDVSVHIEKCKFIQYAQYDEEEEYNPNQEAFDSCSSALVDMFPSHPEIFLFQISYLWGDELKNVFDEAEIALIIIRRNGVILNWRSFIRVFPLIIILNRIILLHLIILKKQSSMIRFMKLPLIMLGY